SVVILFYILLGLLTTADLPAWVRRGALFPAVGAAILVTLVVLLWWRGEAFFERSVVRFLPERFGIGLKRFLNAVVAGMQILPDARLLGLVFVVSLALWFLPILSSYVVIRAFSFAVPFNAAVIVFIFIGFGTALPQAPGMIGTYQYACQLALALFGVPAADALAYGVVLNAIQLASLIAQGVIALPLAGVGLEDLLQARAEAQSEAAG
ncbi:MAG TPA: lysylphosphatidylglycerol synthase transmembrane domain-containing protein, partial [Candidatus Kryptonia bacterium]|nr:lysylphosphatidylglycerol synthase transmembrane domain-containing protein [Candidatus Kryptonia bacterium]